MNKYPFVICLGLFMTMSLLGQNDSASPYAKSKVEQTPVTEESRMLVESWDRRFYEKPIQYLSDSDRALSQTYLFSGKSAKTDAFSVLLANAIYTHFEARGFSPFLPPLMLKRAEFLKGSALSDEETRAVRKLQEEHAWAYGRKHKELFSIFVHNCFYAVTIARTLDGNRDIPKGLAHIARDNGILCDYCAVDSLTEEQLLQLLNENTPVILEQPGKQSWFGTGKSQWLIVFAAFRDETSKELQLLVNNPDETTLMMHPWVEGLYSLELGAIRAFEETSFMIMHEKLPIDLRSFPDYHLGNFGFSQRPFSFLKGYRIHLFRNWRNSAEAWDADLAKLLTLPSKTDSGEVIDGTASLWKQFFVKERASLGMSDCGSLIPSLFMVSGRHSSLVNCLLMTLATTNREFTAYSCGKPGRFFHRSRLMLGNKFMMPTEEELASCLKLAKQEKASFIEKYGDIPFEPSAEKTWFKDERYSISAHLFHSLPQILKGVSSVREAVDRMGPACAWTATVEGGPGTDWEMVKRAIWRRLPIILEGKDGDWRTAFAYLVHNGKKLLLVTKKLNAATAPAEPVLKQYELPEELPHELEFMEYDETQWTPWFAHHFEPTVEHLAPQILEIFKEHPEAKAYREGHQMK